MWRSRRRQIQEIPQASLPDLAFLLLVFFITSMDFVVEQGLPLLLPSGRAAAVTVEPSEVARIQVLPQGRVTLDGKPVVLSELGSRLRDANRNRTEQGLPEFIVLIETHPDAAYEATVGVLDQVRDSASRRISLQLLEPRP
jgi:biopolymer transport protein ExbD